MIELKQFSSTGKPCLIAKNMSNEEYQSEMDFWSNSRLNKLYSNSDELNIIKEPSKTMLRGTNFHCYLLEPARFKKEYYIFDESERPELDKGMTSNKNKEWKANLELQFGNKMISLKELADFERMRDRIYNWEHNGSYPYRTIIESSEKETSYFLADFEGVKVRIRPDIFIEKKMWLGDLKVTGNASTKSFKTTVIEMRYNMQMAFYSDILKEIYGREIDRIFWLAIEPEEPFSMNSIKCPEDAIHAGRALYQTAIDKAKTVLKYQGYLDTIPDGKLFNEIEWSKYDTDRCFRV